MAEFKYRRGLSSEAMRQEIQEQLKGKFAGIAISVEKEAAGPPAGYPVNIEISGEDYGDLIQISESLKNFLNKESIPGVEEIKVDVNKSKPGLVVNIDRRKSGSLGVAAGKLGSNCVVPSLEKKQGFIKKMAKIMTSMCVLTKKIKTIPVLY